MGLLTQHFALYDVCDGGNLVQENIYRPTSLPEINPEEAAGKRRGEAA